MDYVATNLMLIQDTVYECVNGGHYVTHDAKIGIFCNGFSSGTIESDASLIIIDEMLLSNDSNSAAAFVSIFIDDSHNGVAIPVGNNHVLHSIPPSDATGLPDSFQIVDYDNSVVATIDDTTSPDTSCVGFQDVSSMNANQFAFACDSDILFVDYDDAASLYVARSLTYPTGHDAYRTTSFGRAGENLLGDFSTTNSGSSINSTDTSYYVMAFQHDDKELLERNLFDIGTVQQCSYGYEKSKNELVLVILPSGLLLVLDYHNNVWSKLTELQVFDSASCDDILFEVGYGYAYVVQKSTNTIYDVDLSNAFDTGVVEVVSAMTLSYTPYDMEVSGVPNDMACDTIISHAHEEDGDHDDEDHDDHDDDEDHDDEDHHHDISSVMSTNFASPRFATVMVMASMMIV